MKAVVLIITIYYIERIQVKTSQGKRCMGHTAEFYVWNSVVLSHLSLVQRQLLATRDKMYKVLPTGKFTQHLVSRVFIGVWPYRYS